MARKLEGIRQALDQMAAQEDIARFLNNADNAQKLNGLVEDIREAVMDYQVRSSKGPVLIASNVRPRLPYSEIPMTTPVKSL